MTKSYKLVFALILLLILVINTLQITWLVNSVQITKEQYKQTLNRSLSIANSRYLDTIRQNTVTLPAKTPQVYIIGGLNTTQPVGVKINVQGPTISLTPDSGSLIVDTLESYYAKEFWTDVSTNRAFNISLFDKLLKAELTKNDIETTYKLDTTHITGNLNGAINQMAAKKYKAFPIQTWGIAMGTFGRVIIWASFKPYPPYIFKKLLWILIINAIILIGGNTCLLYILKTLRRQKQATEVRNDFISNMTHELKTPVSIIATALDSLLEHKGIDNRVTTLSFLSISKDQTKNLSDLIEKILTTSIADDTLKLNKEPLNINGLVETLAYKYEIPQEKEVTFHFRKASGPLIVMADKLHITNVINNLIENAIKYSNQSVQITISSIDHKNTVTIVVEDNGIGIEKKFQENIFQKFFRVPNGDLYTTKGTGLGLTYCKKIVEQHRGKMWVNSIPGQGSAFFIELPK